MGVGCVAKCHVTLPMTSKDFFKHTMLTFNKDFFKETMLKQFPAETVESSYTEIYMIDSCECAIKY